MQFYFNSVPTRDNKTGVLREIPRDKCTGGWMTSFIAFPCRPGEPGCLAADRDRSAISGPILAPPLSSDNDDDNQTTKQSMQCSDLWIWDWQRHLKSSITIKLIFFHNCNFVYDVLEDMMMQTLQLTNTSFHYMTVWVFTMLVSDGPLTVTLASSPTELVNTLAETLIVFT